MPCKDALFWHYVSTTTLVGLENNVGRDGFISRILEHPYVGGFDHTCFRVPFELAHCPGRKFLKLYVVMALWNAATTYWIANAHPLGVIATVFINGALMAAAMWLGVSSSILWRKFPQIEKFSLFAYLPVIASWIAFEKLHDHLGLAFLAKSRKYV